MSDRFTKLPAYLAENSRTTELRVRLPGGEERSVPVFLAHPDWRSTCPFVLWFHGRTANKLTDSGRYLRWIRAAHGGMAACAVDLPGHGDRFDPELQGNDSTMRILAAALTEIDPVIAHLASSAELAPLFDTDRAAIGGMSLGGMVALRRLCDPHRFVCAAVEGTTGSFDHMPGYAARHDPVSLQQLDPIKHLDRWRSIPLLAIHSEADRWVPVDGIREFVRKIAAIDPAVVPRLHTWPETGAPHEHLGFGRFSNDAKNIQTEFLLRHLRPAPGRPQGGIV